MVLLVALISLRVLASVEAQSLAYNWSLQQLIPDQGWQAGFFVGSNDKSSRITFISDDFVAISQNPAYMNAQRGYKEDTNLLEEGDSILVYIFRRDNSSLIWNMSQVLSQFFVGGA